MASNDPIENQKATYCDECEKYTAGRIVGRLVKCMECGYITEDYRT